MANHMREQIRFAAVAALLAPGAPMWGARVYPSRRTALAESDIPALCLYTTEEDSVPDSAAKLRRSVSLVIEGVVQDNAQLDHGLDEIAREIEAALAADRTLGGLCYDVVLVRTTMALQPVRDAQFKTGSAVLTYSVIYRTPMADASANAI